MPKRPSKKHWNAGGWDGAPHPERLPKPSRPVQALGDMSILAGAPLPAGWRVVEVRGAKRVPVLVGGQEWRSSERAARIEAERLRVQAGGVFEAELAEA